MAIKEPKYKLERNQAYIGAHRDFALLAIANELAELNENLKGLQNLDKDKRIKELEKRNSRLVSCIMPIGLNEENQKLILDGFRKQGLID